MNDFELDNDDQISRNTGQGENDVFCQCGKSIKPHAEKTQGKWEYWRKCPEYKNSDTSHYNMRISTNAKCIESDVLNPDQIEDVTDTNFTKAQIETIIANNLYQRFRLPCKQCKKDTIQIRYQRQTSTMKFYSICVQCRCAYELDRLL